MNPELIVSSAPQYKRPYDEYVSPYAKETAEPTLVSGNPFAELKEVLTSEHGGTRQWIYGQYDQRVGAATARDCSEPVGVVQLAESGRALSVVLGCRPHLMRQDPLFGGRDTVAHPALQMAIQGFEPLAVTDCLNFGNPEKKETMTQFVAALKGMNDSCRSLVAPIISGNVSFYNETKSKNVSPTPSTGLVGLRPKIDNIPQAQFQAEGSDVYVLRFGKSWTEGLWSENKKKSPQGFFEKDLEGFETLVQACIELGRTDVLSSARVVGKFGLLYALTRMSLNGMSAQVKTSQDPFVEPLYQVVLETQKGAELEAFFAKKNLKKTSLQKIGRTQKQNLQWNDSSISVNELKAQYLGSWEANFAELA